MGFRRIRWHDESRDPPAIHGGYTDNAGNLFMTDRQAHAFASYFNDAWGVTVMHRGPASDDRWLTDWSVVTAAADRVHPVVGRTPEGAKIYGPFWAGLDWSEVARPGADPALRSRRGRRATVRKLLT